MSFGTTTRLHSVTLLGVGVLALACAHESATRAERGRTAPIPTPTRVDPPGTETPPPTAPSTDPAPVIVNDERFHPLVRAVVAAFGDWGRVDDQMRWAPMLCRIPTPAAARYSEAEGDDGHARKLYALSALDPVAYGARASVGRVGLGDTELEALEQAIVKESFVPEPTDHASTLDAFDLPHNLRSAEHGGRFYRPGAPAGLFVMMKLREPDEATDAGWVYATVDTAGAITAAGRMQTCMGCHVEAGDDRLFGIVADEATADRVR